MDQGIIQAMKAYYRMQLVRNAIEEIDKTGNVKTISLLEAMMMLKIAWHQVKESTVIACFRKAGIAGDVQTSVQDDQVTPETWGNADDDDIETSGEITDADIIAEVCSVSNDIEDDDSDGDCVSDEPTETSNC